MENNIINITVATANPHKLEEISAINKHNNIKFSIVDGIFNPAEIGKNYAENAYIKAAAASSIMNNENISIKRSFY